MCLFSAIFSRCWSYAADLIYIRGMLRHSRDARQKQCRGAGLISSRRSWLMCGIVMMTVR